MSFDVSYFWQLFIKCFIAARVTLLITVVAVLAGLPLSILVAYTNIKKIRVFRWLGSVYVSFARGTPLMIQIYLVYYILPRILDYVVQKNNLKWDVYNINSIWYAFIVFGLYMGALLGEVFRAALSTVEAGQIEAAHSIGMTGAHTFFRVIFPQSIVVALPNICTTVVNVIKGTSLVFSMTILDITGTARVSANETYKFVEAYVAILIIYVIVCYIVERIFKLLEKSAARYRSE